MDIKVNFCNGPCYILSNCFSGRSHHFTSSTALCRRISITRNPSSAMYSFSPPQLDRFKNSIFIYLMCISLITSWIFSPTWLLYICSSSVSCLIIFYIKGKFLNFSEILFSRLHTGASMWSSWDHTVQIQNTAGANSVISLRVPSWNKSSQKMETLSLL